MDRAAHRTVVNTRRLPRGDRPRAHARDTQPTGDPDGEATARTHGQDRRLSKRWFRREALVGYSTTCRGSDSPTLRCSHGSTVVSAVGRVRSGVACTTHKLAVRCRRQRRPTPQTPRLLPHALPNGDCHGPARKPPSTPTSRRTGPPRTLTPNKSAGSSSTSSAPLPMRQEFSCLPPTWVGDLPGLEPADAVPLTFVSASAGVGRGAGWAGPTSSGAR